jgi:hypothetical protein
MLQNVNFTCLIAGTFHQSHHLITHTILMIITISMGLNTNIMITTMKKTTMTTIITNTRL